MPLNPPETGSRLMFKGVLAAAAAVVAYTPAAAAVIVPANAITLGFEEGSYELYSSTERFNYYRTDGGFNIITSGSIADGKVTGDLVVIGSEVLPRKIAAYSADFEGDGTIDLAASRPYVFTVSYGSFDLSGSQRIDFALPIVGYGAIFSSNTEFSLDNAVVAAIPEPATWAMMIGGFGLAGSALRRKNLRAPRPGYGV